MDGLDKKVKKSWENKFHDKLCLIGGWQAKKIVTNAESCFIPLRAPSQLHRISLYFKTHKFEIQMQTHTQILLADGPLGLLDFVLRALRS